MKPREEKNKLIEEIAENLNNFSHFYLADTSTLNAEDTSNLRRKCFENDIKLFVVKNSLLKKAFDKIENKHEDLHELLNGHTSLMFSQTGNAPAKVIKDFRKKLEVPVLKGAFVEESIYIGDEQLETLATLKSKEELIGDVISQLQAPAINVISALKSGGNKISGVIKTLSEKE
jgi:large subunit ribosomal protein L10